MKHECLRRAYAVVFFSATALFAPLSAEGADKKAGGIQTATSLNFVLATTLETKVKLIESVTVPFLAGNNALTAGNNVKFTGAAELSPVSVNGTFEARLTPVAFLQLIAGGSVGSGWNIPIAQGLRKNVPVLDASGGHTGDRELTGGPFDGLVWSVKGGGLFQFDLAALSPGDWHHLVFQSCHAAQYRALSSASSGESWLYEADLGENRNGWSYYGNYFLGYQMPLRLNLAGFLVEDDQYLYDVKNGSLWGDGLPRWTFGPMVNVTVTDRVSAAVLAQWHTVRNCTDGTADNDFYQDRRVVGGNKLRPVFYRAALNVTVKL